MLNRSVLSARLFSVLPQTSPLYVYVLVEEGKSFPLAFSILRVMIGKQSCPGFLGTYLEVLGRLSSTLSPGTLQTKNLVKALTLPSPAALCIPLSWDFGHGKMS